jgi:hypothetical protein
MDVHPPGLQLKSSDYYSMDPGSESNPFDSNIREALNNSSMNYQSTNRISAILSCSSFSVADKPLKMAIHPCVVETLN